MLFDSGLTSSSRWELYTRLNHLSQASFLCQGRLDSVADKGWGGSIGFSVAVEGPWCNDHGLEFRLVGFDPSVGYSASLFCLGAGPFWSACHCESSSLR